MSREDDVFFVRADEGKDEADRPAGAGFLPGEALDRGKVFRPGVPENGSVVEYVAADDRSRADGARQGGRDPVIHEVARGDMAGLFGLGRGNEGKVDFVIFF